MTPAVRLLKQNKVPYQLLQYEHDATVRDYGAEAVAQLKVTDNEVFKTLLVDVGTKDLVVVVVSMNKQLSLKTIAHICGVKKAVMADKQQAQIATGYLLGGISPLGQKKRHTTFIDDEALKHDAIFVSGGKRGLEIKLSPTDLAVLLGAQFITL